jgi:iron complex outermembrane receptor protein
MIKLSLFSQIDTIKIDSVKTINLRNLIVTGYRPSTNTPISQKTLSNIDIVKDYHGQEITYILEKTPSVTTQSDGGQPNGYAFNIKSIQVQRGIGTSSNGTSSYGGSINFESKNGFEKEYNINTSIGSFNTQMYNISYGSGILKNKIAYYCGISSYSTDGYKKHSGGIGSSAFISGGYYDNVDILKLTAFAGVSSNNMAWLPTPDSLLNVDRTSNILSNLDIDKFYQEFIQLQEIHNFSNIFIVTNTIFYNNLSGMYNMHDALNITPTWCYEANYKSNFYGYGLNMKLNNDFFKINAGVDLNMYDRRHYGSGISDYDGTYDNTGYKNNFSIYAKPEYNIGKFNMYADIQIRNVNFRYNDNKNLGNYFTKQWQPFINYRLGANYTYNEYQKFYLYVGQSKREPTRTDMFGGNEYNIIIKDLNPETVSDIEIGYKLNTKKISINANFYYMYFNNQYISTGKISIDNSMMVMKSVDKSFRSGIEIDGKYEIIKNLTTSNSTTISYNKIISDGLNHMLYSPFFITNQNIEYEYNNFYINISFRYISKSYIDLNDENSYCPEYSTLNSEIGFKNKNIDISVSGINLTNTYYYTSGNLTYGEKCYFVGAPISFYTSLKIKI